jgi:hypothetical protein
MPEVSGLCNRPFGLFGEDAREDALPDLRPESFDGLVGEDCRANVHGVLFDDAPAKQAVSGWDSIHV